MRIVVDLQGAQASNKNRGIGRYSIALARSVAINKNNHEVLIVLNGSLHESINPIRAIFDGLLPPANIRVWEPSDPSTTAETLDHDDLALAQAMREAFIASLRPDIILVTSLFEGLSDNAVTGIRKISGLPTAVVLYDLIPLIHKDIYLSNPIVDTWYRDKLEQLKHADLLLSISASSGNEAIDWLNFPSTQVVNISTACDAQFVPRELSELDRTYLGQRYGLTRPYIMYTGGIDHRKNIEGLIRAYAQLPTVLRMAHQLAVVCSAQSNERDRLLQLAAEEGLMPGELVMTGFVSEKDIVTLYNACTAFVFPSLHEGFGLPALEAMQCGKAVITSNTSSLPEVVGLEEAMFDPSDTGAIAKKLIQVLTDAEFRSTLEQHSLLQAKRFNWDRTAQRAIIAMEQCASNHNNIHLPPQKHPRLAYVSPLPPERSGISFYSADLLQALTHWYTVDVVVDQPEVTDEWVKDNCTIRSSEWFRANHQQYDRVLYHFGNSHFHHHMFALLEEIPGIVVLHDFFLSGIQAHRETQGSNPHAFAQAIFSSHGYPSVRKRFVQSDIADVIWEYPCNLPVLQNALGVIVHSESSKRLADQHYGLGSAAEWSVIPLLRMAPAAKPRLQAKAELDFPEGSFVVCSFGMLGPTKLNHRLLGAFLQSELAKNPNAYLVFVGENHDDEYGESLLSTIWRSGIEDRIRITGWVDCDSFQNYLAAADIGVQLRTKSRGETSAAVLDCMNHGMATVVNANGSMADLDSQGVWSLPDEFDDTALVVALESLWGDSQRRIALGISAKRVVADYHNSSTCASQYFEAIEHYYHRAASGFQGLLKFVASQGSGAIELMHTATVMAKNFPPTPRQRQLLVDVSELVQRDAGTGIQRVTRALLGQWLGTMHAGWRVEPVYASPGRLGYRYARTFTCAFLGIDGTWAKDEPVDAWPGDIFLGLDLQPSIVPEQQVVLDDWYRHGVDVRFVVYDLLPVLNPEVFGSGAKPLFEQWLACVSRYSGAVCISQAVADELRNWMTLHSANRSLPFDVKWFHLGADIESTHPTKGFPPEVDELLNVLMSKPCFLMVGTLEPRKSHHVVLQAFDKAWEQDHDVTLVIVGKQGWMVEDLVETIHNHHQFNKNLFWLKDISDEYLEHLYKTSACLIAASAGEGFGLPLIEAAQHKLPVIANSIPVFREVAREHAYFFDELSPENIAKSITQWLDLYARNEHPKSDNMPWLTWKQSADQLLTLLGIADNSLSTSRSTV